jgi:hypothetical protein
MDKKQILNEIEEYKALIAAEGIPQDEKDFAAEEIQRLEKQLGELQPAKKKGRPAKPKPEKKRTDPQPIQPGDKIAGVTVMDDEGRFLDSEGEILTLGDTVEFEVGKDGTIMIGTIVTFAKFRGGGHSVSITGAGGRKRGTMVAPNKVTKLTSVDYSQKLPVDLVAKAVVVDRKDCDENQVVLVKPTDPVVVNAPMVADPENGDMIMVNKQGHPIAVIEGDAVKTDYEIAGKVKIKTDGKKVQEIINEVNEEEEKEKDKAEQPDNRVKARKPTPDCDFVKGEEEPALQTFIEGMRQMFREGETSDKIERIMLRKSDKKLVLQIKRYFLLDIVPGIYYYTVCLSTGKLTPVKTLQRSDVQTIMGMDAMKDFYRSPNNNTCRRVSKELHVTCYREGNCTDERKKRLLDIFTKNCRKREDETTRAYRKFTHAKASERYSSYTGEKSYTEIYREVIGQLKAGKLK